jgi:hypothetical protein
MPTIASSSAKVLEFPNRFISPFGNDPVFPLYSSVPLFNPQTNCLPCAACGNYATRNNIIQEQAQRFEGYEPFNSQTAQIFVGSNLK